MVIRHATSGRISRSEISGSGEVNGIKGISIIWIDRAGFSMRDGGMLLFIVLLWDYLRISIRFIGSMISVFLLTGVY